MKTRVSKRRPAERIRQDPAAMDGGIVFRFVCLRNSPEENMEDLPFRPSDFGFRPPDPRRGFTLIEVLISAALMALIIASAYLCLNAGIASQKLIEPRTDIFQNARVAMALMTADLRGACPLSRDYEFLGLRRTTGQVDADNVDFATHNYTPRRPREGDFCEISYYLDQDPENGQFNLYRRRNPTIAPDPLNGGSKEEIARGVVGLRFEYYDGVDWYDSWGDASGKKQTSNKQQNNLTGMPDAVRITLLLDSNQKSDPSGSAGERTIEPPLVFQTVARLELADRPQSNSGGGNDNSNDSNQNDNTRPGGLGNGG